MDTYQRITRKTLLRMLDAFADLPPDPVVAMYQAGDKIDVIQAETGVARATIFSRARRAGVRLRTAA